MFTNPLNERRATRAQRALHLLDAVSALTVMAIAVASVSAQTPGTERDVNALSVRGTSTASDEPLVGVTTPSKRVTLAAVMPARIAAIRADEGAAVTAGDVLIELDDAVQRARTAIAKAAARTTIGVELAKAEWDHTRRDLVRLERLRDDSSASTKELNDARSLEIRRRLEYDLAVFTHEQAVRAYEREQALLEEHRIRVPFSGYVIEHLKHAGETVDPLEGIATMVQLDPLLVTVDCPLERAGTIAVGSLATLTPMGIVRGPRIGRVTRVSRVADAGSQTFRVKIEVENDDDAWIAGMKVAVQLAVHERTRVELTAHQPDKGASSYRTVNPSGGGGE